MVLKDELKKQIEFKVLSQCITWIAKGYKDPKIKLTDEQQLKYIFEVVKTCVEPSNEYKDEDFDPAIIDEVAKYARELAITYLKDLHKQIVESSSSKNKSGAEKTLAPQTYVQKSEQLKTTVTSSMKR